MITSDVCEKAEIATSKVNNALRNMEYIASGYEEGHPKREAAKRDVINTANMAIQVLLELIREEE